MEHIKESDRSAGRKDVVIITHGREIIMLHKNKQNRLRPRCRVRFVIEGYAGSEYNTPW